MATDIKNFNSTDEIAWCPGCGDFGILNALKTAMSELDLEPHEVLLTSGIGQAAKTPHYINLNGFNGLHGRAIPPATGAKIANKDMNVVVTSGDGDMYGEGGNHIFHNIRRNIDITALVYDNQIYGLTKGQASPTTAMGQKTTMQFNGVYVEPFNPISYAVNLDCSFVARAFSGHKDHLVNIIKQAMNHRGFALVDILQPCVSFNHVNTHQWYRDRVYQLDDKYDPTDKKAAMDKALEWGDDGIPIGVIYKTEKPTYLDRLPHIKASDKPLIEREWSPKDAKGFMEDFR